MDEHRVDPADEGRHPPEGDQLWNESWYADFVAGDGSLAGYMRWGLYPNMGVSWWTTTVVRPDEPLLASVDYRLAVPGDGLAVDDGDWSVSLEPSDDLQRFRVRADAPATRHAHAWDVYDGDAGEPAHLGMDLTWSTDGVPYHYVLTTRYEVPCTVSGELTIDGVHVPFEGQGQRDHSWGVRDWWTTAWCWMSCRLDDATRLHTVQVRLPGGAAFFGYVQRPAEGFVTPVTALSVDEELGDHGLPLRVRIALEPGPLVLDVEPVAFGPLLLTAPDGRLSRFPRAHIRVCADDGRTGDGWIEFNQPRPSTA